MLNKRIKYLPLFGGIDSFGQAFKKLGIEFEIVDYVEIDKFAVKSFNAINDTNFEPQDVRTWDKYLKVDLITHGSPCQDFSIAGNQAGGDKDSGTRSSLMYDTVRIVKKIKPKYVVWENVKNILSKKHRHNFDNYLDEFNAMGYTNYWQVLDASDYGIPQKRERVFVVSIMGEHEEFVFPPKQELKLRLKDLLAEKVGESFYIKQNYIKFDNLVKSEIVETGMIERPSGKKHQSNTVYSTNGLARTLCATDWKAPMNIEEPIIFQKAHGYNKGGVKELCPTITINSFQENNLIVEKFSGYSEKSLEKIKNNIKDINGCANTITANPQRATIDSATLIQVDSRVRKLTPLECWRLMGFSDEAFYKAKAVSSNTQLYKQAGNSIVVNVTAAILKELFKGLINE